jgi:DNA-binding PucR family transcriptional regulator
VDKIADAMVVKILRRSASTPDRQLVSDEDLRANVRSYSEYLLNPLGAERGVLLDPLAAWLNEGGSGNRAAPSRFFHPNTIRHRLRRIEERTWRSLTDPRGVTERCLALESERRPPHPPPPST